MAPNLIVLAEASHDESVPQPSTSHHYQPSHIKRSARKTEPKYKWKISWRNVIAFIYLHGAGLYGMYMFLFVCTWKTFFWTYFFAFVAGQGITSGAHRLWAHRAYKAKLGLRIFLMLCQTAAFQNCLYEWVRDHRVHHKFTDTDADPHNAQRGFFFSHIGWLMIRKHNDVKLKGKTVDMSDLLADPVVRFQRRYYLHMIPFLCFLLPFFVPWYFWNEDIYVAFYVCAVFRYAISLNFTWLVNSAAHIWGNKPYDKNIGPTENIHVAIAAFGEGWHNYHHVFPWDYKAAELGNYGLNPSTMIIDMFSKFGWAYDLKTVSPQMIERRVKRTGDGTRKTDVQENDTDDEDHHHHHHGDTLWGWDDVDMKAEDRRDAQIINALLED